MAGPKRREAEWLRAELKDGPRPVRELMYSAAAAELDWDEVVEEAEDLGVIVCPAWRLPE